MNILGKNKYLPLEDLSMLCSLMQQAYKRFQSLMESGPLVQYALWLGSWWKELLNLGKAYSCVTKQIIKVLISA